MVIDTSDSTSENRAKFPGKTERPDAALIRPKQAPAATTATPLPDASEEVDLSAAAKSIREQIRANSTHLNNAISYTQTQGRYLEEFGGKLDEAFNLAAEARDNNLSESDRANYSTRFKKAVGYLKELSAKQFNGIGLFNGAKGSSTNIGSPSRENIAAIDLTQGAYSSLNKDLNLEDSTAAAAAAEVVRKARLQLGKDSLAVSSNERSLVASRDPLVSHMTDNEASVEQQMQASLEAMRSQASVSVYAKASKSSLHLLNFLSQSA